MFENHCGKHKRTDLTELNPHKPKIKLAHSRRRRSIAWLAPIRLALANSHYAAGSEGRNTHNRVRAKSKYDWGQLQAANISCCGNLGASSCDGWGLVEGSNGDARVR